MKLQTKLIAAFLGIGILPVLVVGYQAQSLSRKIAQAVSQRMQSMASDSMDKIERNLFERYGDIQAFGYNAISHNQANWYKPAEDNQLVQAMNKYMEAYGVYYLTVLVDTEGKVAAVNSKDAQGRVIDTAYLYEKNFRGSQWFQDAMAGKFLQSPQMTGTVVEDVYVDPDIQRLYRDEGLCLGFAAPVKDGDGKVIGVWKNFAKMSIVEEIVGATNKECTESGLEESELTLINSRGVVIVDCDPSEHGKMINHDMDKVIFKRDMVADGSEAAKSAVKGGAGSMRSDHPGHPGLYQTAAYSHSVGALGYPGLGWSLLIQVPEEFSLRDAIAVRHWVVGTLIGVAGVVLLVAFFLSRRIVLPIRDAVERLEEISFGEGDLTKKLDNQSKDEVGQLAEGFNAFVEKLREIIHDVKDSTVEVTSLATQIAASAEEMSAAVSEVAHQTTQVASTAEQSGKLAEEGRSTVEQTVVGMDEINTSVKESAESVGQLGSRGEQIGQVISVINDIADQTNLLALNAAIEAARAGEHGRGFAVVADEVRKLAERTTKATEEIGGSISAIQTETQDAVNRMNQGRVQVERGVELAAVASKSMDGIATGAAQVSSMITSIAAAAEEAGAGARESAQAAAKLSAKAESLASKMSKFSTERRARPRKSGETWTAAERQSHLSKQVSV